MVQGWAGQDCSKQNLYSPNHRPGWPAFSSNRLYDGNTSRRCPPMEIHEALEAYCGIPVKHAFVAVIGHDNEIKTYMSPGYENHHFGVETFFDDSRFRDAIAGSSHHSRHNVANFASFPGNSGRHFRGRPDHRLQSDRRRVSEGEDDEDDAWPMQGRKRHRGPPDLSYESEEKVSAVAKVTNRATLRIGDSDNVHAYYAAQFNEIQQGACKTLAKAWIKLVEPKKQTLHPYTGKEESKPDWWPGPWGNSTSEKVRHKEPDHLYKKERVHLLVHILRLIIEPTEKQNHDLRKMGVNLAKLEEITMDALTTWFKESKPNEAKRPLIKELFKVARQEEKYLAGGVDDNTLVYVTRTVARKAESQVSGSDDGVPSEPSRRESISSAFPNTPPALHDIRGYPPSMTQGAFINELPLRGNSDTMVGSSSMVPYGTTLPQTQAQHQSFDGMPLSGNLHQGDNSSISMNYLGPVSAHESNRRSSGFPEFSPTSTTNEGMYQQPQWSGAPSASGSPSFPYSNQGQTSDSSIYMQTSMAPPIAHNPAYVQPFAGAVPSSNADFQQQHMPQVNPGGGYSYHGEAMKMSPT